MATPATVALDLGETPEVAMCPSCTCPDPEELDKQGPVSYTLSCLRLMA